MSAKAMCPYCGDLFRWLHLIPAHGDCPGSQQIARCPESDARPLWNGEPNPHFVMVGRADSERDA